MRHISDHEENAGVVVMMVVIVGHMYVFHKLQLHSSCN